MQSDIELKKALLPHLFLLLKLPEKELHDLRRHECALLNCFSEFLDGPCLLHVPQLETARQAFRRWASIQLADKIDPQRLATTIREELSSGGHLPLFIREQNAGLLISVPTLGKLMSRPPDKEATRCKYESSKVATYKTTAASRMISDSQMAVISSFPASLPSHDVTSSIGAPTFVYPTTSVRVALSPLLQSDSLAELISYLDATKHSDNEVLLLNNFASPLKVL